MGMVQSPEVSGMCRACDAAERSEAGHPSTEPSPPCTAGINGVQDIIGRIGQRFSAQGRLENGAGSRELELRRL